MFNQLIIPRMFRSNVASSHVEFPKDLFLVLLIFHVYVPLFRKQLISLSHRQHLALPSLESVSLKSV